MMRGPAEVSKPEAKPILRSPQSVLPRRPRYRTAFHVLCPLRSLCRALGIVIIHMAEEDFIDRCATLSWCKTIGRFTFQSYNGSAQDYRMATSYRHERFWDGADGISRCRTIQQILQRFSLLSCRGMLFDLVLSLANQIKCKWSENTYLPNL